MQLALGRMPWTCEETFIRTAGRQRAELHWSLCLAVEIFFVFFVLFVVGSEFPKSSSRSFNELLAMEPELLKGNSFSCDQRSASQLSCSHILQDHLSCFS